MNRFIVCLFLALTLFQVPAIARKVQYPNGDFYFGGWDSKNSYPKGKGTMQYANGDCYVGLWANGKQQGKGKMTYADGSSYNGQWKGGSWNGTGRLEKNGDVYKGFWKDGYMNGEGTIISVDGSSYRGNFNNGVKEGYGVMKFADGSSYNGEWIEGKMDGQGLMTYADGSSYNGQWKGGLWNGTGRLEKNGDVYDGVWEDGYMNGEGAIMYVDGSSYRGNFSNGVKEGYGVMKFADGSSYNGEWHNDNRYGAGVLTNINHERIESEHWDGDMYSLPSTITNRYGNKRRIYVDDSILKEYRKETDKYSSVTIEYPELGEFKGYIFQSEKMDLEEELYQADRFPLKYIAEGTFTYENGEKEYCFNRPLIAWGLTVNSEFFKGEWIEIDVYAKPSGGIDNKQIDSTPNYTQSATMETYMTDRKYTFNSNGTGVFVASTISYGYVPAMAGRAKSGGRYYSYTTSGGFEFTTTGTVKISFTWMLDNKGALKLGYKSLTTSVKSEPDIEKYRSQSDPTYFKQWSSSVKSSFQGFPDVKHAEKHVRGILESFKMFALGDFLVLFPETDKMYLYDLDSDSKYKRMNHPYRIMDSIMGFEHSAK